MAEPGLVETFRIVFKEKMAEELASQARTAGKKTAEGYQQGAAGGLESFFKKIAGWLAAAFAVHKVVEFAKESIRAATESEKAWSELGFSLQKVGVNIEENRARLEKLGKQFLDKTTFGDEAALRGLNTLVQITGDYELSLHAVEVAADLAAAKHLSLEEASTLVGRGLNGNTRALKLLGIELVAGKGFLEQMAAKFQGAAENELNTFGGKVKQVANFWGELKEEIGKALIEAGSGTSVMDTLIGTLKGAATWVAENKGQFVLLGKAIQDVAEFLLKGFLPAISKIGPSWRVAFAPIEAEIHNFNAALREMRAGFNDGILGNKEIAEKSKRDAEHFRALAREATAAGVAAAETLRIIDAGGGSTVQGGAGSRGSVRGLPVNPAATGPGSPGWQDRLTKDLEAGKKKSQEWSDFNLAVAGDVGSNLQAITRQSADIAITAANEIEERWKTQQAAQMQNIREADSADETAIKKMLTRRDELAQMIAEWDEEDRERKKQAALDQIFHIEEVAFVVLDLAQNVLDAGDAWGLFSDKAGKALQETINNVAQLAESTATLAAGIVSGNPASIIQGGLGVIESIGNMFHRDKDPGRMKTNDELFAKAKAGDAAALEKLLSLSGHSGRSGTGAGGREGWGTQAAQDDAWDMYQQAKMFQDAKAKQAAGQPGAETPTTPTLPTGPTPEEIAQEKERMKDVWLNQTRGREEEDIRLRELDDEKRAQEKLIADAQGLSDELRAMVAAAVRAQQQAERIGETGPLGFDSPLFRDAKQRADRAFDEASRSVADAVAKAAEAGEKPDLMAQGTLTPGFSVTRTLTETSANRVVGELITSNVWLERIYNRMGVGAGLTTGGGTPGIMADRYSTQALLAGNPEIPN